MKSLIARKVPLFGFLLLMFSGAVYSQPQLGVALNATGTAWTTGGQSPWSGQTAISHDGHAAAASGPINHNQESWVETTVNGSRIVHFYWKVSSETHFDYLRFYVNGIEQFQISGEVDWEERGVELPAGTHTLRWAYTKDGSVHRGQDRGWLDQVSFTLHSAPLISVHPLNRTVVEPESVNFSVNATGTAPLSYQWQRSTDDGATWSNIGGTTANYSTGFTNTGMNGYRYRVRVSNGVGSVTSASALLTVYDESFRYRGNFGWVQEISSNAYFSETYGLLEFAAGGTDHTRAYSESLQADLLSQGGGIYSPLYGRLTPNQWGIAQWVVSEYFGLVHFGEDEDQYAGWVSSERFGWMRFVEDAGGTSYLWVHRLQTWMSVQENGSLISFDFGWLVPEAGNLTRYNSRIGILIDDEHNPDGWLRSDRFGFVWFAREGTGVWFWSERRNEWIGITPEGGLWSTAEGAFL